MLSNRNMSLIYRGGMSYEILTIENYHKWYDIYIVSPSNHVYTLCKSHAQRYNNENPGNVAWREHVPTPDFCKWLERNTDFVWDDDSLDMIYGRWYRQILNV